MTEQESIKETKPVKAKRHIRKHKKKYGTVAIVTVLISILELYPVVKKAIATGDTKELAVFGKTKLMELQDAGVFTE